MQLRNGIGQPPVADFVRVAQPVGTVEIVPGCNVSVHRWPNWLHRTMTRWLLGWRWEKFDQIPGS